MLLSIFINYVGDEIEHMQMIPRQKRLQGLAKLKFKILDKLEKWSEIECSSVRTSAKYGTEVGMIN